MTTARRSPVEDRRRRIRAYIIAMVIRTISFPLAVWAFLSGWVVVGFVLAAAATFLPQIAVMMANAVDRRTTPAGTVTSPQRALPRAGPPTDARTDHPTDPPTHPSTPPPHGTGQDGPDEDEQDGRDAHL